MIEAMAGNVLMAADEYHGAATRFETALQRYPNKMQLVYDYPEALMKANRPAASRRVRGAAARALSRATDRCTRSRRARTPTRTCA